MTEISARYARAVVQADLDDPERAGNEFDGFFGRSSFAEAIDRFICGDLVVHGWDLARATGQDECMDPDELKRALPALQAFGDALRSPQVMGPPLDPPLDADEQTTLLAFTGRRSW